MARSSHNLGRAALAARAMRKPLRSMQRELAGVRGNEDIECVHRMRVASRRLRNALDLFGAELPEADRDGWRQRLKNVTKSLGAARDLDVQIDFLRRFLGGLGEPAATYRPGIELVLSTLAARRAAVQDEVCGALDRVESSRALPRLVRWVRENRGSADEALPDRAELRAEAARVVLARLGDLLAYEPFVEQPDAVSELHAMRIAAKHLRYTLEAYAPLYPGELAAPIDWGRQLQDWLGEIHDCDVWHVELGRMLQELADGQPAPGRPPAARARRMPGIEHLRRERSERRAGVYAEFVTAWRQAAAAGYWLDFRRPFEADRAASARAAAAVKRAPQESDMNRATKRRARATLPARNAARGGLAEDLAADERLQPVFALAQACHYEVGHTHQVTRLALRFFDKLARLHGLDDERRFWLTCAALLHDIGWVEGRAGHHKTAPRLIRESPRLPWDQRLRRIVGSIARYHRKALPSEEHGDFAALSAPDRADVRKLAAILRLADALDYSHANVVEDVACRVTARRLSVRCTAAQPAEVECERAAEKGDLAAEVFEKEIGVTWHLR